MKKGKNVSVRFPTDIESLQKQFGDRPQQILDGLINFWQSWVNAATTTPVRIEGGFVGNAPDSYEIGLQKIMANARAEGKESIPLNGSAYSTQTGEKLEDQAAPIQGDPITNIIHNALDDSEALMVRQAANPKKQRKKVSAKAKDSKKAKPKVMEYIGPSVKAHTDPFFDGASIPGNVICSNPRQITYKLMEKLIPTALNASQVDQMQKFVDDAPAISDTQKMSLRIRLASRLKYLNK